MNTAWDTLKVLADPTRLRLLHLLRREELSVAELQEVLDMGQSRISSHLALLRQGGLVSDRREGKRTFYSSELPTGGPRRALLEAALQVADAHPEVTQDRGALRRILERRRRVSERYFNEVAGRLGKSPCPGRSWEAIGHFLLFLTPSIDIADLGAGEGMLAQLLSRRAKRVYCVDSAPRMVEVGSQLAREHGIANLEYRLGDIEQVPLEDHSVDLAFLSQALHHADRPLTAIREACRILRPGGRLLILDLLSHNFEQARDLFADRWLGFSENTLDGWLREAGLTQVEVRVVAREVDPPHFETLLGTGVRGPSSSPSRPEPASA